MSQRGSAPILPIVIASVLGLGLVASVYLNYIQHQHASDVARQLNGTITDLRYQLGLDAKGSPTPTPASPTPSPSPTQAVTVGSSTLAISELGVKLTTIPPLADLTYSMIPAATSGATVAGLSSPSFVAKYPSCSPGTALGQLVRRAKGAAAPGSNHLVATLGNFSFYYYQPGNSCATTDAGKADVAADVAVLNNTILKSLTQ